MPSPRMPPSPREAPSTVQLDSRPLGSTRGRGRRAAIEGDAHAGGARDLHARQSRDALALIRDQLHDHVGPLAVRLAVHRAVSRARARRPPSRAGMRARRRRGRRRRPSRAMPDRDPVDAAELHAPLRRVEGRRDALAPGRAAQPGEIDDVGLLGELAGAVERHRRVRLADRIDQHDLRQAQQRVDRLGVAVRRPHERRDVGHDERVDDRVQLRRGASARGRARSARASAPAHLACGARSSA